jgi:hypothetical protein
MIINYHLIKDFPSFSVTKARVFLFLHLMGKGGDIVNGYKEEGSSQEAGQKEHG